MEFIAALFGRGSSDNFIPSSSTETSARISKAELNTLQSQFVLSKISNRHVFKSDNGNYLQRTVNESSNCYQGGSVSITGQLNNSNIGRINFELNNCTEDGLTINGTMSMNVTQYDSVSDEPSAFTLSFNNLSIKSQGEVYSALGTQSYIRDNNYIETITTNMLQIDNNNKHILIKDFITRNEDLYTEFTGKIFLEDHGYIDITTPEAVRVNDTRLSYVGYIQLTGAASSKAKIAPEFTGIFSDKHRIDLDADGDGIFEYISINPETTDWNNLESLTENKPPVLITEIDNYQGRELDQLWINDNLEIKVHAYDPEGYEIDYLWTLESSPTGSSFDMERNINEGYHQIYFPESGEYKDAQSLSFGSYEDTYTGGEYIFSLKVTDADGMSTLKFFNLNVLVNELPTAIIKNYNSQRTFVGDSITLDSYDSFDTETDNFGIFDIEWKIVSMPIGSDIRNNLSYGYTYPVFQGVADLPGIYTISLKVKDENGGEDTEIITINVQ